MKRSARLARHYIRAHDLRALYIVSAGNIVRLAITRDPAEQARAAKRHRARIHCVYWASSSAAAAKLIDACCSTFPGVDRGGRYRPRDVEAELRRVASSMGHALTADADVQGRAAGVVAEIDRRVKAMQDGGQLRGMNAGYRAARAEAGAQGMPFHSYGDHLERYKIKMLYQLASAMRPKA